MLVAFIVVAVAGVGLGMWSVYFFLEKRRRTLSTERASVEAQRTRHEQQAKDLDARQRKLEADTQAFQAAAATLKAEREQFDGRSITAIELERENRIIKRDLANIEVTVRKLQLDRQLQAEGQEVLDQRGRELAQRYLIDVEKWVGGSINANNYAACKQRLTKAVEWCRGIGFEVTEAREAKLLEDLKADYERAVRAALEREEQARIKAQIREEQQREREIQRALEALEREKAAIQAALAAALAQTQNAHSLEIQQLRARLADAEARTLRTQSLAELTKTGHIYVISNLGSFGDRVYKIGMTRRLDPQERVDELGDASVPFPFDVHMMISCPDAPALEKALHQQFHRFRVNKMNPRKEFFRLELADIRKFVESRHGEVRFIADAEALEYRQSQEMSEEDQEYIEQVFERSEKAMGTPGVED